MLECCPNSTIGCVIGRCWRSASPAELVALRVDDLELAEDGYRITIRRSKTADQLSKRSQRQQTVPGAPDSIEQYNQNCAVQGAATSGGFCKMTAPRLVLTAALVLVASKGITMGQNLTSIGGFMDGSALLDACDDPTHGARCQGYIMGVADAVSVVQLVGDTIKGRRVCIPKSVALSQVTDIVVAYVRAHPGLHQRAAAALVGRSLFQSFPCR
jgi:hypothetical protein